MTPTNRQIDVAINALRTEAGVWDGQSDTIGNTATKAEGLRLGRLEAGMFQVIVGSYDAVVDQVSARCAEGKEHMSNMADTLRNVAKTYEEEEAANVHDLKNIY